MLRKVGLLEFETYVSLNEWRNMFLFRTTTFANIYKMGKNLCLTASNVDPQRSIHEDFGRKFNWLRSILSSLSLSSSIHWKYIIVFMFVMDALLACVSWVGSYSNYEEGSSELQMINGQDYGLRLDPSLYSFSPRPLHLKGKWLLVSSSPFLMVTEQSRTFFRQFGLKKRVPSHYHFLHHHHHPSTFDHGYDNSMTFFREKSLWLALAKNCSCLLPAAILMWIALEPFFGFNDVKRH